jgi:carbon-monoxide dehydrogenase large subunit
VKNRDGSDTSTRAVPSLPRTASVTSLRSRRHARRRDFSAGARDAAELIDVEYEPLPAVIDPIRAVEAGAPVLFDEAPNNIALDWELGDRNSADAAFAKAAKIVKIDLAINRVVVNSIEARSVVGEYDAADDRYTVHLGSQGVFGMRRNLASGPPSPRTRCASALRTSAAASE